jgi:hypothetical protein
MNDAVAMHIVDSGYDLLHEPDGLAIFDALLLDDVFEQLATVGVLHD